MIQADTVHVVIKSPIAGNDLDIFYERNDIVLSMGKWTHTHPETIDELILNISQIIKDEIIIWKVTRPDGSWYSGHYNLIEWMEDRAMVDEPDTYMQKGDRIERSTFNGIIEDRIFE